MILISYNDRLLNRINNEVAEGAYLTSEDQYVLEGEYGQTAVVTVEDESAKVEGFLNPDKEEALENVLEQEDLI